MNGIHKKFAVAARAVATAAVGLLAAVTPANAQTNLQPEPPRVSLAHTNHLKATVLGVDYKNREVILQGTNGSWGRFAVSEGIKNFDQVRQGDEVNIAYYESVAFAVMKPGELSSTSRTDAVATQPGSQTPGGGAISVSRTTATIQSIDRDNRQVVLKGANGEIVQVYVDPTVGNLKRIKEGDQISVSMTKAIAVSVEKPGDSSSTTNSTPQ